MSELHLASQFAKLIEKNYKEKAIVTYQLEQLNNQLELLNEQIDSFEKTLGFLDPTFDFRSIRKTFDMGRLMRKQLFDGNLQHLVAQVLKQATYGMSLYSITNKVVKLDKGLQFAYYVQITREQQCAVGNVIRKLYKQGLLERQDKHLHHKIKKRGIFERSEWRLKFPE
ncbi:hypothetical protein ACWIW6_09920 [Ursidibacter sp. B-7004-1]